MKKILLCASFLALVTAAFSQFEGTIAFVKTKGKIDVNFKYLVKEDMVRLEEYGEDEGLDGIQLVNTTTGVILGISPERMMYMEAKNKRPQRTANISVEKTKSTKTIAGKTCTKWIVTCKEQDKKIIYWVTTGQYAFFNPLLKALNRAEKTAVYWRLIENNDGVFPLLAEEYNMAGVLISKLEVSTITDKKLEKELFEVPEGYKKFERD
jgi:hypothetical protein